MNAAATLIAEGLRGKRLVVTGGTGFIGGRLVEQLAKEYAMRAVVLVRSTRGERLKRMGVAVEVAKAAITDRAAVSAALKGCNVVFHCAYDWVDRAANLQGVRNLIEACLSNGARLVHVSTFAIYHPFPNQRLTEDAPAKRSGWTYSDSKLEIETEIVEAVRSRGLDAVILMPTLVYGAHGGWTCGSVRKLLTGTVILPGEGDGLCNAVHVDDVCQALLLAAVVAAAQGRRYFVSADVPVTWRAFFESYARIVGCPGPRVASEIPVLAEPASPSLRGRVKRLLRIPLRRVTRSAMDGRIAYWMRACFGDKAHSWIKRLYYRHAAPVVHTMDAAFFSTKCHIVIDKIVRELGYAPAYDLERGMAATAPWIKDKFRDEIWAVCKRQR
jgi:nucleoside-diphosphate-sugar epimerase